ncbi:hypothetical protein HPB48_004397 [Haemaphysalis longicornis]|uniref:Uncharacterized protein n=1 Tax=Haemaphysalis longicornis TaxID=44386 RepID=A0A9J6G079_HAELO|nr:hypothetical protein HPB48_004397 [Haemaphysalis longicornis]
MRNMWNVYSFQSEQFQDDLFPDTAAPTPALTAAEWLSGKNRNPILISMKTGAGARTHKPVMYTSERNLVTADRNNERKFVFISQENNVDYRQKANHTNNNHNDSHHGSPQHNNNAVNGNSGQTPHGTVISGTGHFTTPLRRPHGQHFGWRHVTPPRQAEQQQADRQPVCDVVSSHTLPVATFVTIQDHDSSASEPELDGDVVPQTEDEVSTRDEDTETFRHLTALVKSELFWQLSSNTPVTVFAMTKLLKLRARQLRQLRKAFHNQSMELRKLRSQLASKEKKIRELESQLQLQESSNGC